MTKAVKADPRTKRRPIRPINMDAAGIDIGSTFHVVAVPPDRVDDSVRNFQSFTGDLHAMADWLDECKITTVAMESTGVYWIPAFEILEARKFTVILVNSRSVKNVPGRKTDVNDAQWLQQLHEHGLLRGSFRPDERFAALRAFMRHRSRLVECAASHIQRMQKALMQMNIQLHHAVTDITGVTGMRIVAAIISGVRDPESLAEYRDVRCKQSVGTLQKALTGNYRPEHVFSLRQSFALYEFYQLKIKESDQEVELLLQEMDSVEPQTCQELPSVRHQKSRNEPAFDARSAMFKMLGADLTQIHDRGPYTVLRLISECGNDMRKRPTAKHFTSWLGLAPGNKISGGRVLSSRTRKTDNTDGFISKTTLEL